MSLVEYRETIDYVWVVSRQLDRVAEAASSIDVAAVKRGARLGLLRYAIALRQLYVLVKPVLRKTRLPDHLSELEEAIEKLLRGDARELARIWRRLDQIQMEIVAALNMEDLLVRKLKTPLTV